MTVPTVGAGSAWRVALAFIALIVGLLGAQFGASSAAYAVESNSDAYKATVLIQVKWEGRLYESDRAGARSYEVRASRVCSGVVVGSQYVTTVSTCLDPTAEEVQREFFEFAKRQHLTGNGHTDEQVESIRQNGKYARIKEVVSAYRFDPVTGSMTGGAHPLMRVYSGKTDTADLNPGGHTVFRSIQPFTGVKPPVFANSRPMVGDRVTVIGYDGGAMVNPYDWKASSQPAAEQSVSTVTGFYSDPDGNVAFTLDNRHPARTMGGVAVNQEGEIVGLIDQPAEVKSVSVLTDLDRLRNTAKDAGVTLPVAPPTPTAEPTVSPMATPPSTTQPSAAFPQEGNSGFPVGVAVVILAAVIIVVLAIAGVVYIVVRRPSRSRS